MACCNRRCICVAGVMPCVSVDDAWRTAWRVASAAGSGGRAGHVASASAWKKHLILFLRVYNARTAYNARGLTSLLAWRPWGRDCGGRLHENAPRQHCAAPRREGIHRHCLYLSHCQRAAGTWRRVAAAPPLCYRGTCYALKSSPGAVLAYLRARRRGASYGDIRFFADYKSILA